MTPFWGGEKHVSLNAFYNMYAEFLLICVEITNILLIGVLFGNKFIFYHLILILFISNCSLCFKNIYNFRFWILTCCQISNFVSYWSLIVKKNVKMFAPHLRKTRTLKDISPWLFGCNANYARKWLEQLSIYKDMSSFLLAQRATIHCICLIFSNHQ